MEEKMVAFEQMVDIEEPKGFSSKCQLSKKLLIGIGIAAGVFVLAVVIIVVALNGNKGEEEKIRDEKDLPIYKCLLKKDGLNFTEQGHRDLARKFATEGMVLAQNTGLPIKKTDKVVLFGNATEITYYGGGGSSEMFVVGMQLQVTAIKVLEGMEKKFNEGKFIYEKNTKGYLIGENLTEDDIKSFASKGNAERTVAVFSVNRYSREARDREQNSGEFGTELSEAEKQTYNLLVKYFDQVVVVLNVPSVMELGDMVGNDKTSILIAFFPGVEAGNAIADVLVGDENPSGHLSHTWAKTINDYPTTKTFLEYGVIVKYKEGLFVGYRYFELDAEKQSKVAFPFGFGLSYTTFSLSSKCDFNTKKEEFTCTTTVKNTGKVKGKQVVQVYAQKPENKNFVKAPRELVAFSKTKELSPGESQELKMSFHLNNLTSYDETGVLGNKSCYVLEAGNYKIYVGTSVADTRDESSLKYTYKLDKTKVVEKLTTRLKPSDEEVQNANTMPDFKSFMINDDTSLKKVTIEESIESRILEENEKSQVKEILQKNSEEYYYPTDQLNEINMKSVLKGKYKIEDLLNTMTNEELVQLLVGHEGKVRWSVGAIGGNFNAGPLRKYYIPMGETNDGGGGLKHTEYTVSSVAWPCGTLLGSTFNVDLMRQVGEETGNEARIVGTTYWLAPGLNIHRSPLCGRNFEYYAEDPILTGKMGAAVVKGFQSKCMSSTIKHFALNNREKNRLLTDSRVAERVAREIYLKGFEIVIKEARPWAVMSAYNVLNGLKASASYDLLTGILRDEWGFEGLIFTDWDTNSDIVDELNAGGVVKMRTGNTNEVLEALKKGTLAKEKVLKAGYYLLNSLANTNAVQSLLFEPKSADITNGATVFIFEYIYNRHQGIMMEKNRDYGYHYFRFRNNTWISIYVKNDREGERKARIKYSTLYEGQLGFEIKLYEKSLGTVTNLPETVGWSIFKFTEDISINLPKGVFELTIRSIGIDEETDIGNVYIIEFDP